MNLSMHFLLFQAWISGEEYATGEIYQTDPTGARKAEKITMGSTRRGRFESFAFDERNKSVSFHVKSFFDSFAHTNILSNFLSPRDPNFSQHRMKYSVRLEDCK